MNTGDRETVIRLARIPDDRQPLEIYAGDTLEPIPAFMVAISLCRGTSRRDPTYVLYFLDQDGEDLELLQYETMRAALDEAHRWAGIQADAWTMCRIEMPEDGRLDPAVLEALLTAS